MDKKIADFIYVAMIVAVIGFLIFMVFWLKGNSTNCLRNPIEYFEEKNEGAECFCYKEGIEFGAEPETVRIEKEYSIDFGNISVAK